MQEDLTSEYRVYLHFRELGYNKAKSLLLLGIAMEMVDYEMEKEWQQ